MDAEHAFEEPINKRKKHGHNEGFENDVQEKEMIENTNKAQFLQFLMRKQLERKDSIDHDSTLSMTDWKPEEYDHSPITFKGNTVDKVKQTDEVPHSISEEIEKEEENEPKQN